MALLDRRTRTRRISGSAVGILGLLLVFSIPLLNGEPAPYVRVRWRPGVAATARQLLEARLSLRERNHEDRSSGYDFLDPSRANIVTLVSAAEVEDTNGIDRSTFELRSPVEYGESRTGLAWRLGLGRYVPWVSRFGILLFAIGLAAVAYSPAVARAASHVSARVRRGSALVGHWDPGWPWRGIPAMTPEAFGIFRVVFALSLGALLLSRGIERGSIPLDHQRALAIPLTEWIPRMAAMPFAIGRLQLVLAGVLALFAAGVFARTTYAFVAIGFNVWFCTWALTAGTHSLGTLPLSLLTLLIVPWHEGQGFDRWRSGGAGGSRVPYGFAPWVLCVALGVGFAAAGFAKLRTGPAWVLNGTVRYHFMAESEVAWVPWGLWIAARPRLSVLVSLVAVAVEHLTILAAFAGPRLRMAIGAMAASLFAGFILFHNALWPAWWVLLFGFLPWEWINGVEMRPETRVRMLPRAALLAVGLLVGQQIVVSGRNLEVGPFFSAYDMYSATFDSPAHFERANGGPRFHVWATTPDHDYDAGDCVRADRGAILEMEAALRADVPDPSFPVARRTVVSCAAKIGASTCAGAGRSAGIRLGTWPHGLPLPRPAARRVDGEPLGAVDQVHCARAWSKWKPAP